MISTRWTEDDEVWDLRNIGAPLGKPPAFPEQGRDLLRRARQVSIELRLAHRQLGLDVSWVQRLNVTQD